MPVLLKLNHVLSSPLIQFLPVEAQPLLPNLSSLVHSAAYNLVAGSPSSPSFLGLDHAAHVPQPNTCASGSALVPQPSALVSEFHF
ncbi:hypothetical protein ACFX1X_024918 [Malus domestica]